MDWNDTLTLLILADTVLNAKLLVAGYFLWRWWQRRKVQVEPHWESATTTIGTDAVIENHGAVQETGGG